MGEVGEVGSWDGSWGGEVGVGSLARKETMYSRNKKLPGSISSKLSPFLAAFLPSGHQLCGGRSEALRIAQAVPQQPRLVLHV